MQSAESKAVSPGGMNEERTRAEVRIHGVYRHYKGDSYIVEDIALHSETGEKMVIYRALYGDGQLWARPYDLFIGEVEVNGEKKPRFEAMEIESLREK